MIYHLHVGFIPVVCSESQYYHGEMDAAELVGQMDAGVMGSCGRELQTLMGSCVCGRRRVGWRPGAKDVELEVNRD